MLTKEERNLLNAALAQLPPEVSAVIEKTLREYEELMTELTAISLTGEKWRWIRGYEGVYMISTKGRIASFLHGKVTILKPSTTAKGYLHITLCKNGNYKVWLLHRLVAEAFIPNPHNLPVVHHKNDNPANNGVENLEWSTYEQNSLYAVESGAIKTGENNHAAKLTEEQVRYIRKVYTKGHPEFGAVALARKFNVTKGTIFCIIRGKSWKHVK